MAKTIKGRTVNRTGLAEVFGVALPTVDMWRKDGCPVVTMGGRGKEWEFDTAEVANWLRERDVRAATGDRVTDKDELQRRKLAAETEKAELELAKAKGEVAPLDQVERAVARAFAEVRAGMRNLPQRTVSMLIGETDERRFKSVMMGEIDEVLKSLVTASLLDGYDEGGDGDSEE